MADDEEKEEPTEGSAEWREKCQAMLLAPSLFKWHRDYDGENGWLAFELKVGDWSLSIVPEWNSQNQTFDNYMLNVDDDGKLNYDGDMNWDSLSEAQQAVERFMGIVLFEHMSEAFISLPEGMNYLYELSKEYRENVSD
jgi:hypothetical protein